jgi:hypothetical protein
MDFFCKFPELHINFDPNINWKAYSDALNYANQKYKSIQNQNSYNELKESFSIESDKLTNEQYNQLINTDSHDISYIHSIISKSKLTRTREIGVIDTFTTSDSNLVTYLHVGLRPTDIDLQLLQNIVDEFYNYVGELKPIIGFICYLLYIRIHPHEDGNGRTARFLFLDNIKLDECYFPFINSLSKLGLIDSHLVPLYKKFTNFKQKSEICVCSHTKEEYYTIHVTENLVKRITNLLYRSKMCEYFMLMSTQIDYRCICTTSKLCQKYAQDLAEHAAYLRVSE